MISVGICDADTRRCFQQRRRGRVRWAASAEELDEGPRITGHGRTVMGSPTPVLDVFPNADIAAAHRTTRQNVHPRR